MIAFTKKLISDYESFSIEGQNAIFYHLFATAVVCINMVISCFKQSSWFQWSLAYLPIAFIISFLYYNPMITWISLYIKVNHPKEYSTNPSTRMLGFGRLKMINPASIKEPLLSSIRDEKPRILIKELTFYWKALIYCTLTFFLFYFVFGTLLGLALNSH